MENEEAAWAREFNPFLAFFAERARNFVDGDMAITESQHTRWQNQAQQLKASQKVGPNLDVAWLVERLMDHPRDSVEDDLLTQNTSRKFQVTRGWEEAHLRRVTPGDDLVCCSLGAYCVGCSFKDGFTIERALFDGENIDRIPSDRLCFFDMRIYFQKSFAVVWVEQRARRDPRMDASDAVLQTYYNLCDVRGE